jgi:hypothetical protein
MAGCNEHVECLQEKIADYRHWEDIGLVFISIGGLFFTIVTTLIALIATLLLIGLGAFLFVYANWRKEDAEARLCNLLKSSKIGQASEPKASERKKSFIEDNSIQP